MIMTAPVSFLAHRAMLIGLVTRGRVARGISRRVISMLEVDRSGALTKHPLYAHKINP
jgi:hypothetical protein